MFIYIRGEYSTEYEVLSARSRRRAGADCSAASSSSIHRGAGAYICGEETGLLESLEGNADSRARSRRSRAIRVSTPRRR